MVWIYGGAFYAGSSSTKLFGPDFLMTKDVILVTFNYRLSVFGFLNFKDSALDVPGNATLKDQRMVLKWVKQNIENFGGDPNNITLFGHSAGAVSVALHLISESSRGLFNRAIVMACSALNIFSILPPTDMSERVAKNLGWNGEGGEAAALEILISASPESLIEASAAQKLLTLQDMAKDMFLCFGPILEPYDNGTLFLNRPPLELMRNPWSKDLEVIFSYASNEGILQCLKPIPPGIVDNPNPFIMVPYEVRLVKSPEEYVKDEKKLRALYNNFEGVTPENIQLYLDVSAFLLFIFLLYFAEP